MSPRRLAFLFFALSACAGNYPLNSKAPSVSYYTEDGSVEFSVDKNCFHKKCCQDGVAVLAIENYSIFSSNSRKKVVDATVAAARSGAILQNGTKLSSDRFVLIAENERLVSESVPLATIAPISKSSEVTKAAIQTRQSILALEIFAKVVTRRSGEPHAAAIGVEWTEYHPDGTVTSSGLGQGFCGIIDSNGRVVLSMTSELNID